MTFPIDDELRNDLLALKPEIYKFRPTPIYYANTTPDRWELLDTVQAEEGDEVLTDAQISDLIWTIKQKGKGIERLTYWIYIDYNTLYHWHTWGIVKAQKISDGWKVPDTVQELFR